MNFIENIKRPTLDKNTRTGTNRLIAVVTGGLFCLSTLAFLSHPRVGFPWWIILFPGIVYLIVEIIMRLGRYVMDGFAGEDR